MSKIRMPKAVVEAANRADEMLKANAEADQAELDAQNKVEVVDNQNSEPIPIKEETKVVEQPPENREGYWEHRFKTVEGILNAQQRKSADALREQEARINGLVSALTEAKSKVQSVPKQFDLRSYLSEEEINGLGDNLPNLLMKISAGVAHDQTKEYVTDVLEREIEPLRKRAEAAEQNAAQVKVDLFWKTLNKSVPDWQVLNGDPKFLNWLTAREGYTKFTRDEILKDAERNLDADTVVEIFTGYKALTPTGQPVQVQKKVIPETAVASAPATNGTEAPLFTTAQVRKFYNDSARGAYRGREAERVQMEANIDAAIQSGRIG